ncbi:hypothetical protein SARC_04926 [Sphaeroforma arctica JP610]|uniref:Uncharacterized protein n=1 Tax=Sphaeroforma arctica JP610 TaxID=667725 RepID=A0A0L0G3L2_9EUKA|nr:hypothetical protein SARC_04926 [Sphaeroforma arctica JP610]KNC82793.1 hypothetical protein SARC_04926 [Sphaeroforma arctica JP610]|eukprot:XP_014156695.1 hypothetical protein SARC_04926 [Sphaeroforma arctica JP610]
MIFGVLLTCTNTFSYPGIAYAVGGVCAMLCVFIAGKLPRDTLEMQRMCKTAPRPVPEDDSDTFEEFQHLEEEIVRVG